MQGETTEARLVLGWWVPLMARHRQGKRLRGFDPKRRHGPFMDLGRGVGLVCQKCGQPKERADQDETECSGRPVMLAGALRQKRELAVVNLVLAWSWARIKQTTGHDVDPAVVLANKTATRKALLGLDSLTFRQELERAAADSKAIYQAVDAETDPRDHCLAACLFVAKLADANLIQDPTDQSVLTALGILSEAKDTGTEWNYRPGVLGRLADQMVKKGRELGYFGGKLRSFGGI